MWTELPFIRTILTSVIFHLLCFSSMGSIWKWIMGKFDWLEVTIAVGVSFTSVVAITLLSVLVALWALCCCCSLSRSTPLLCETWVQKRECFQYDWQILTSYWSVKDCTIWEALTLLECRNYTTAFLKVSQEFYLKHNVIVLKLLGLVDCIWKRNVPAN